MNRRRWWVIGGAAGVVVIAAGLWIWQSASRPPTAEESVIGYLRALESGDPAAVEATGIVVTPAALDAFDAADTVIEDGEVTAVSGDDARTGKTAEISFLLDGRKHAATLSLERIDGRWTVDASGLGTTTATATIGSSVSIGDATIAVAGRTALLPATYTVAAAPATLLDGESSLVVLPGEDSSLALEASLRPEATEAAQKQLEEYLTTCTVIGTAPPAGCGIRIPWGTEFRDVSEFRYRIEQLPTITLTDTGFHADGGVLVTTVSGTGQDGSARTTTYRTESWAVRGDVSFTAEDVVLAVW